MSRFNVNDVVRHVGSLEKATVTAVRERKMVTFYQVDDQLVWMPERLLCEEQLREKVVYCSQLQCQRKLDLTVLIKDEHYVLDQYGFHMCAVHLMEDE